MHSSVIASLLDTRGSHGQKCRFLELFLGCLPEQFKSFVPSGARTACERCIGQKTEDSGGRVDICIENSIGQMIVIENKIFAGDQEHQILRYVEFLRGRPRKRDGVKFPVLYLTPDGHSPSDDSTQADGMQCRCGEDYVCISYKDVIVPWLDKCINEMQEKPHLKEHLTTYRDIIKKKVFGMDRKKDIISLKVLRRTSRRREKSPASLMKSKLTRSRLFGGQSRSQSRRILRKMACVRSIATLTQIRN